MPTDHQRPQSRAASLPGVAPSAPRDVEGPEPAPQAAAPPSSSLIGPRPSRGTSDHLSRDHCRHDSPSAVPGRPRRHGRPAAQDLHGAARHRLRLHRRSCGRSGFSRLACRNRHGDVRGDVQHHHRLQLMEQYPATGDRGTGIRPVGVHLEVLRPEHALVPGHHGPGHQRPAVRGDPDDLPQDAPGDQRLRRLRPLPLPVQRNEAGDGGIDIRLRHGAHPAGPPFRMDIPPSSTAQP